MLVTLQFTLHFLLTTDVTLVPETDFYSLTFSFLGKPVHESLETGRTHSKIQLNWSLAELNQYICQSYPNISLNLIGFELARTGKGWKIKKNQVGSVRELKAVIGKSRLYIVPQANIMEVCNYIDSNLSFIKWISE